jgi:hypothetical protein
MVRLSSRFSPFRFLQGLANVGYQKNYIAAREAEAAFAPSASQMDQRNGEIDVPFFALPNHSVLRSRRQLFSASQQIYVL